LVLLISLVFGGATREEVLSSDFVGLAALPVLVLAALRLRAAPRPEWRLPLLIIGGLILLPLFQLIPLPAWLWTHLPGRPQIASDLRAAGLEPGWAPISLSPRATWSSLLALLPPLAIWAAVATSEARARATMIWCLLVVGVVSVIIGCVQIAGGPDSPLRFYAITNPNPAVGFFSNRNHLASLLACLIPLAAAGAAGCAMIRPIPRLLIGVYLAIIVVLVVGIGLTQSRAGVLLLAVAGLGALAMVWRAGVGQGRLRVLLAVAGVALVVAIPLAETVFGGVLERFQGGLGGDDRLRTATYVAGSIVDYLPFGSGLGTFVPVYKMVEQPSVMLNTYLNHAHNDWLEVLLEGGLLAAALLAAFLVWFGRVGVAIWRRGGVEATTARAAWLVILLLLLHSLVDYPLRSAAMMSVFALACGALVAQAASPGSGHRASGAGKQF
jgi:O-antigen ligase